MGRAIEWQQSLESFSVEKIRRGFFVLMLSVNRVPATHRIASRNFHDLHLNLRAASPSDLHGAPRKPGPIRPCWKPTVLNASCWNVTYSLTRLWNLLLVSLYSAGDRRFDKATENHPRLLLTR